MHKKITVWVGVLAGLISAGATFVAAHVMVCSTEITSGPPSLAAQFIASSSP